jgi:hypothetical protein
MFPGPETEPQFGGAPRTSRRRVGGGRPSPHGSVFPPPSHGYRTGVEVPGPVTPDQPVPGGPPSVPEPSPSPMPGEPGRPGVPEPSPPVEPQPDRPDVPEPDPKGPETPEEPIEPEPQIPPGTDPGTDAATMAPAVRSRSARDQSWMGPSAGSIRAGSFGARA